MTVLFVQTTQLATGRTYDVSFNNYDMTDLAGNALYSAGASVARVALKHVSRAE